MDVEKLVRDKIEIERIRGYLRISIVEDKVSERQVTLYVHVRRRSLTTPIRRCLDIQVSTGADDG